MKEFHFPLLAPEAEITFAGIPDEEFDRVMDELDEKLQQQMRENELRESESILFAAKFITT